MADLFQTSVSGLLAAQQALATTSHNISNVNTDGYSRQRVEQGTRTPQLVGSSYLGTGVNVETVRRIFDQSLTTAVQTNTADYNRLDTFAQLSGRIDSLLADSSAGVSPALQDFFGSAQKVAADPTDSAARQDMLDKGQALVSRFHQLSQRLGDLENSVDQQLQGQVKEVNQLADSIARLNQQIAVATGKAQGNPPNDLLDKRDSLIKQLSGLVKTRVVYQDNGAADVSIGKGDSLVTGSSASHLEITKNKYDLSVPEISLVGNNTTVNVTDNMSGGSLGGLLDFRREVLYPTMDHLGRVATTVAVEVNKQQNLGIQFDSQPPGFGADFFGYSEPKVLPGQSSNTTPQVTVNRDAVQNLPDSNLKLTYTGSKWVVTKLSDNSTQDLPADGNLYGLHFDTSSVSPGPSAGDTFLIEPTRNGASGINSNLTRPGQIAAAAAFVSGDAVDGSGQSTNAGTGEIGPVSISSKASLPAGDVTLTYDDTTSQFTVSTGGSNIGTISYNSSDSGQEFSLPGYSNVTFTLSGTPKSGDQFVIQKNTAAVGDNANVLAIGALQDKTTMDMQGGVNGSTFQESYSSLVSEVGNSTSRANTARDAQKSILDQAVSDQQNTSGVNLEEEAANMLKYQKAYQAAAQSISIANTLFQSILNAVG